MNDDLFYAPIGTKVKFLNRSGYDHEPKDAVALGLAAGVEYTLSHLEIGSSSSSIYLEEFPSRAFNSVMFECLPYTHETSVWMDEFRYYYG